MTTKALNKSPLFWRLIVEYFLSEVGSLTLKGFTIRLEP